MLPLSELSICCLLETGWVLVPKLVVDSPDSCVPPGAPAAPASQVLGLQVYTHHPPSPLILRSPIFLILEKYWSHDSCFLFVLLREPRFS